MLEKLQNERQELINNILFTQQYYERCEDDVERKHISYQLRGMNDYLHGLNARLQLKTA